MRTAQKSPLTTTLATAVLLALSVSGCSSGPSSPQDVHEVWLGANPAVATARSR